ncbi:MAG: hypothetical protein IT324_13375 [Anaerolineae bacterium]|nr:hypothetical protein [Anaerolineae bacterium]
MTPLIKRLPVLALAAVLLALVLYGGRAPIHYTIAATEPAGLLAARPVIQAQVNGQTFEGTPGSYCWPSAQAAPACDFVDDPQPTDAISVAAGDTITFQVVGASGGGAATAPATTVTPPADMVAVLLDDQNADGVPRQVNLSQTDGIFTVEDLTPGPHRIAVDALYTAEGSEDQPFVRYVFLLQVGQESASAPTTAAGGTSAPTRAATTAAPSARTAQPTVATRAVTAAATTQAPAATTPAATTAVAVAATATLAPTTQAGVITATQPQAAVTEEATPAAETAIPTTSPTTSPIVPTNVPTDTPVPIIATPTLTQIPPTPTVIPASPTTEVLPTLTASPTGTDTPLPLPTVEPMTPTPDVGTAITPAETPQTVIVVVTGTPMTVVVTATPVAGGAVLPEQSVIVGGRRFEPIAVSVCVLGQGGEQICVNRPQNANAERITAAAGDVAQLNFNGPRPTSLIVSLLTAEGNTVINKQTLSPDNLVLYGLPTRPGSYVFSVEVNWPQGKAIYYYRLVIGG